MKTCKHCGTSANLMPGRKSCRSCFNANHPNKERQKNLAAKKKSESKLWEEVDLSDVTEPAPAPTPDPLASAYNFHKKAKEKRDISKEHRALVEENMRLKAELEAFGSANSTPLIKHFTPSHNHTMDAIPFLVASDWHVEEPVLPEEVQFLNEYNLDIAEKRAELFYKNGLKLAQIVSRDCNVDTMVVAHLGDLFSGSIHDDLMEANLLGPGDAANFVRGLVISGIEYLLKESDMNIILPWMDGNHGRMTHQMRIQTRGSNSLELFMMRTIAERYANNPRVSSVLPHGAMMFTNHFENFKIRWIHGDNISYGGGVGGITIPIRKKLAAWDKAQQAKLTVMGHFHQLLHGGDFVVNGSLIGYAPYGQSIGASPEKARQAFFTVNARGGGEMGMFAPIWLD